MKAIICASMKGIRVAGGILWMVVQVNANAGPKGARSSTLSWEAPVSTYLRTPPSLPSPLLPQIS